MDLMYGVAESLDVADNKIRLPVEMVPALNVNKQMLCATDRSIDYLKIKNKFTA